MNGHKLVERRANSYGCTIGGDVGAGGAGYGNLRDTRLVDGGENLNAIHGAIGDEDALVCGIVSDVPMMRFAEGIVRRRSGVCPGISGARKRRVYAALYREGQTSGMREVAARALHGDRKIPGSCS